MLEKELASPLKSLGVSATVISILGTVALGFFIYSKILDAQLRKLQIKIAKRDLAASPNPGSAEAAKMNTSIRNAA